MKHFYFLVLILCLGLIGNTVLAKTKTGSILSNGIQKQTVKAAFTYDIQFPDSVKRKSLPKIQFHDQSTGKIKSWLWHFSDGSTSKLQNPKITYNNIKFGNTITVCLYVKSSNNSVDSACVSFLTIKTPPPPPVYCQANFSFYKNDSIAGGSNTYQFIDNSQGKVISRYWKFGDGTASYVQNPVHSFDSISIRDSANVCLYITTSDSCSSYSCRSVYLTPPPPPIYCQSNFGFYKTDSTNITSKTYQFRDYSAGATSWLWNFGDGKISNQQNPVHSYDSISSGDSTIIVCLTIQTSFGCTSNNCQIVYRPAPPEPTKYCAAGFSYSKQDSLSSQAVTYQFNDYSRGSVARWIWNFGDGSISYEQNPIHSFDSISNSDSIHVCLNIFTYDSCSSIYCLGIPWHTTPPPVKCAANFYIFAVDSTQTGSQKYQFYDYSGNADNWYWSFGDGNTSYESNPTHTYNLNHSDSVSVCLTILSMQDCQSSLCKSLFINVPVVTPEKTTAVFENIGDELKIKTTCKAVTTFSIEITNISGKVVLNKTNKALPNNDEFNINISKLSGNKIYYVRAVTNNNEVFTFKFLKL